MHHVNTVSPSKTLEGPTELHLEYSQNFKPCFLCKTFVTKKETNLFVHKICLFVHFYQSAVWYRFVPCAANNIWSNNDATALIFINLTTFLIDSAEKLKKSFKYALVTYESYGVWLNDEMLANNNHEVLAHAVSYSLFYLGGSSDHSYWRNQLENLKKSGFVKGITWSKTVLDDWLNN